MGWEAITAVHELQIAVGMSLTQNLADLYIFLILTHF